jgi:hypothetical protein
MLQGDVKYLDERPFCEKLSWSTYLGGGQNHAKQPILLVTTSEQDEAVK